MLVLPLAAGHLAAPPGILDGEREGDALQLQGAVGSKIEHKVVEQLIGSLGDGGALCQQIQGIDGNRINVKGFVFRRPVG